MALRLRRGTDAERQLRLQLQAEQNRLNAPVSPRKRPYHRHGNTAVDRLESYKPGKPGLCSMGGIGRPHSDHRVTNVHTNATNGFRLPLRTSKRVWKCLHIDTPQGACQKNPRMLN